MKHASIPGALIFLSGVFGQFATPVHAASSTPAQLLALAAHDTNTVRTIAYTLVQDEHSARLSFHQVDRGQENEVANTERHHVVTVVNERVGSAPARKINYTIDLIFVHGRTYIRSNLLHSSAWQERPGTRLTDPILRSGGWQRGRTTVAFPNADKFTVVSRNGQVHLRARGTASGVTTVEDVYVSSGAHPYVVRILSTHSGKVNNQAATLVEDVRYGPFNAPVNIGAPSTTT